MLTKRDSDIQNNNNKKTVVHEVLHLLPDSFLDGSDGLSESVLTV